MAVAGRGMNTTEVMIQNLTDDVQRLTVERDEAMEAARWLYDHCDDPHAEFEAGQRWKWLEDTK
jgi:hypothetical protein